MIKERIQKLQNLMKENGIDLYIIPTSDYHQSEYVGEYFAARKYMSGFTGSAGTLIVGLDNAYLWVDGRYHIQAEKQLAGSGITLMKMGLANVKSIAQFLDENQDKTLGFDGRVLSYEEVKAIYDKYYKTEKFIRVLDRDLYPQTKWVEGSNYVDINFKIDPRTNRIIMMGAIDNLVKGAAGQAVQNMNLMFGEEEDQGLQLVPMFP